MTEFAGWVRPLAVVAMIGGLGACSSMMDSQSGTRLGDEAPGAQVEPGGDACGASNYQSLVGTGVGLLQASTLPENSRTIFPGMMVTQDFRPERLNVEIGTNDEVTRVYCG